MKRPSRRTFLRSIAGLASYFTFGSTEATAENETKPSTRKRVRGVLAESEASPRPSKQEAKEAKESVKILKLGDTEV